MTAISNNIIQFPKNTSTRMMPPQSVDEIEDNVDNLRFIHIQESLEAVIPIVFNSLAVLGFDPDTDEDPTMVKDGCLIVESIRSFLCKNYKLGHPLQLIAKGFFNEDNEGDMVMVDNLTITMNQKDETK